MEPQRKNVWDELMEGLGGTLNVLGFIFLIAWIAMMLLIWLGPKPY